MKRITGNGMETLALYVLTLNHVNFKLCYYKSGN